MRKPKTLKALEALGRVRLSRSFYFRNFLHSEVANFYAIPNIPDDPDLAVAAGRGLCENVLQPLHDTFGAAEIRSAFRSARVNRYCNRHGGNCDANDKNAARHIWDRRDGDGYMGAVACVMLPWYLPRFDKTGDWRPLAWWLFDHLPCWELQFFPKNAAFNVGWHENPSAPASSGATPRPRRASSRGPAWPTTRARTPSITAAFPASSARRSFTSLPPRP